MTVLIVSLAVSVGLVSSVPKGEEKLRHVEQATSPRYDDVLVQARAEGEIVVAVTVLPSGKVDDATVVETFWPPLNKLHEAFAKRWRFESAKKTTDHRIVFRYRFLPETEAQSELGWTFAAPSTVEIRHARPRVERSTDPGG